MRKHWWVVRVEIIGDKQPGVERFVELAFGGGGSVWIAESWIEPAALLPVACESPQMYWWWLGDGDKIVIEPKDKD